MVCTCIGNRYPDPYRVSPKPYGRNESSQRSIGVTEKPSRGDPVRVQVTYCNVINKEAICKKEEQVIFHKLEVMGQLISPKFVEGALRDSLSSSNKGSAIIAWTLSCGITILPLGCVILSGGQ